MSLQPIPTDPKLVFENGQTTPVWQAWLSGVQRWLSPIGQFGTTAQRPTKSLYVSQTYFDTTLGKPIWVKAVSPAIVWVDATGGVV